MRIEATSHGASGNRCWACSSLNKVLIGAQLKPGDYSLCTCGAVGVCDEGGRQREPTSREWLEITRDPVLLHHMLNLADRKSEAE